MAVVECMEVYQQAQRHRKAKLKAGNLHVVGCLLIGQRNENLFPNMRLRHGVHIRLTVSIFIKIPCKTTISFFKEE